MEHFLTQIFIHIVNTGYQAGIVVLAILIARAFLGVLRVPKKYICFLWLIPFLRLVLPVWPQSAFSLLPEHTKPVPAAAMPMEPAVIMAAPETLGQTVNQSPPAPPPGANADLLQAWMPFLAAAWAVGAALLLLYGILLTICLKRKLCLSICWQDNIYLADGIPAAFVMGLFRPRIYLPSDIPANFREYVVCHETAHIKRKDHIAKAVIFALTCLYWFHPLIWLARFLAGRDIEFACDEAVIQSESESYRQEYAAALLSLSAGTKKPGMIPVAFSKGSPKKRIQHIIAYKKPLFLIAAAGAAAILLLSVSLLTDPVPEADGKANTAKADIQGSGIYKGHSITFPASEYGLTEYSAKVFEIDRFSVFLSLPAEWKLAIEKVYPGEEPQGGFSPVRISDSVGYVGTIDFDIFDPPPAEEENKEYYYRMVYDQIMLSSFASWDYGYTPIKKEAHFESAVCRIMVKDENFSPEDYTPGILAYDSTLGVYIKICFDGAAPDSDTLNAIAGSISFSPAADDENGIDGANDAEHTNGIDDGNDKDHAGLSDDTLAGQGGGLISKPKVQAPVVDLAASTGADGVRLYYVDEDIIIFGGYFGLFVYSKQEREILRGLDLDAIGCGATQGDNACDITVSEDGATAYLHPMSSDEMYIYSISENTLQRAPYDFRHLQLYSGCSENGNSGTYRVGGEEAHCFIFYEDTIGSISWCENGITYHRFFSDES